MKRQVKLIALALVVAAGISACTTNPKQNLALERVKAQLKMMAVLSKDQRTQLRAKCTELGPGKRWGHWKKRGKGHWGHKGMHKGMGRGRGGPGGPGGPPMMDD